MKVLITAATAMELELIKNKAIRYDGVEMIYCITGVGAVSTVFNLSEILHKEKFDIVIQVGIAGSFDKQLELGNTVAVEKELLHEMGVFENNHYKTVFEMGLIDGNTKPFTNSALINQDTPLLELTGLKKAIAITNNEISTSTTKIKLYREKYGAEIESMEGAAFHYVAIMKSISFIQLRGISNYVGDRDKNNWKIKEAILSYSDACNQLIKKLMLSK
jgi:futalosine hydrolase